VLRDAKLLSNGTQKINILPVSILPQIWGQVKWQLGIPKSVVRIKGNSIVL
jgi:hypothetical protein